MVVQSGKQAAANANAYKTCTPGMCLKYVRTWLEIGSQQPDAFAAWNAAKRKHVDGKDKDAQTPPRGAPVFWKGSGPHGHIALALSNEHGRSTDTKSSGLVGSAEGDWWRENWSMDYLGWTEDLNGTDIPYLIDGGKSEWSHGRVYVSKLHQGQVNSDSVARLCYRLMHHARMPASHVPPRQVRSYGQEILEAVRYWQRNIASGKGPTDGERMSNAQANRLFGKNYTVIEDK